MLKRLFIVIFISLFSSILMANVLDFLPTDTSAFVYFENNEENYSELKNVPLFDFVLQGMGLEFLISLNLNQIATSQDIQDPSEIWNILKGDVVIFSTSSPEEGLKKLETQAPKSPEEVSPDEVLKSLETMNFGIIVQPKGDSKKAFSLLKKLLNALNVNLENLNIKMIEYSGYILISNSEDLIADAKKAYAGENKFTNNPENSKVLTELLAKDAWIRIFAKTTDPEKILKDLTDSDVKVPVKYGDYYGWMYFDNKKLVGNGHLDYKILDESLKLKEPIADVGELESSFSFPGQVYIFANLADVMKRIDYIFEKITEAAETQKMNENDKKDFEATLGKIKDLVVKLDGKISAGIEVGQSATATSFEIEAGLVDTNGTLKSFLEAIAEKTKEYNGKPLYILDEGKDGIEVKAFIDDNKLFVTSLNPDEVRNLKSQASYLTSNPLYKELSGNDKRAQVRLFADIGKILEKLVGMPVDSGILMDVFVSENSIDNRLIIK